MGCNNLEFIRNSTPSLLTEDKKIITTEEMLTRTTMEQDFIVSLVVIMVNLVGIVTIMQEECVLDNR